MTPAGADRNEQLRLAALASYRIIDSVTEPEFDMLSRLVATICETPISLISLVDADRQWCKSTHGVEDCGTSREFSFCARAIARPTEPFVVPDTLADPSFARNPLVTGDPYIRFYAGVPLVTRDGFALGTLCVIDRTPRSLSQTQRMALGSAARVVMTLIEQRVAIDLHAIALKRATLLQSVADNASDAIVILETDRDGALRVTYANDAFATLTGAVLRDFVGSDLDGLSGYTSPTLPASWYRAAIAAGVPKTNEVSLVRTDGTSVTTEMCIGPGEPPDDDGKQHWLVVMRDVSALRRRDELRHAESHDISTGLLNEAGLLAEIETRRSHEPHFAIACFEIEGSGDDSSQRNDATMDGEAALAFSVVRRLLAIVDATHTIARTGEREFTIVIAGSSEAAIDAVVASYARELAAPYRLGTVETNVTASVGTAHASPTDSGAHDVLARARVRLAASVVAARARPMVRYANVRDRGNLEATTLREALHDGAFHLDFQPIVALEEGSDSLIGFEALLRWPDGQKNGWTTLDAILAAERTGFIQTLGSWILDRACAQLGTWQREYGRTWGANRLSVNVSPGQIENVTFERDLRATLERHRCDPNGLTLELTETASMREPEALRETLVALRRFGIAIDLDDFGTGYSSLGRLHTFSIDRLKIDREFVSGAGAALANERIVETILSLAERMGVGTVAEGVETREQRDALYRLGCRSAQGYLFGEALTASEATTRVAESK